MLSFEMYHFIVAELRVHVELNKLTSIRY